MGWVKVMARDLPLSGDLTVATTQTVAHYDRSAESFWRGTKDHDVSQNVAALLGSIESAPPFTLLDFGCGPGRDLATFTALGHRAMGLDGAENFVRMAREHSGCEVFQQDFLKLELPNATFDGIFANAVLFHVPRVELPRVVGELWLSLKPGGVLFASNPHGPDVEEWHRERYGCYLCWETWSEILTQARFKPISHYYRPSGRPRAEQPWLASVWRK